MLKGCTKFEVSSFNHSGDMLWGSINVIWSSDHNHAPLGDGLSSLGWD